MEIYLKKYGWVKVIRDSVKHLGMYVSVPGYTFFLASYQEALAIREERK